MAYGPPPTFDPTNVMGRRIAAWIIDLIPALVIGFVVVGHGLTRVDNVQSNYCDLYHSVHGSSALCIQSSGSAYTSASGSIRGTGFLLSLLYWFALAGVLQGLTGATLGKHILGLRVVDQNGQVAGLGKALLRTFIGVFEIGLCFPIALITALVTHPHRRLGDFAAGTFVVAASSVGTPIGAAPGASPYPPAWTPPPQTWGPPPAGSQPWGAPTPGWGAPPASAPPQTWGTPAAGPPVTQPPAQTPTTWGAPPPDDAPAPAPQPAPQPAPEPAPQPAQPPAQQPTAQAASGREPQWDAQRNAWVFWEVETSRWLQHDPATGQWGPLKQ